MVQTKSILSCRKFRIQHKALLLVPYDRAQPGSKEDSFNYQLSSSHIYVECAFGTMYTKWGILWKPLQFRLKHNVVVVIDTICWLHNFLIDYEPDNNLQPSNSTDYIDEDMTRFLSKHDKDYIGIFCDEGNISHTKNFLLYKVCK